MRSEHALVQEPYKPQWKMDYRGSQFIFEDQLDRNNIAKGRLIQFKHEMFANLSHLFIGLDYRALGRCRASRVPEDCLKKLERKLRERGISVVVASLRNLKLLHFS